MYAKRHKNQFQTHENMGLPNPSGGEGGAHWEFWNERLKGAKILFCGRGLKKFHP